MVPESELMAVGFEKIFGRRRNTGKIKLYIDNDVAKEIVDTIGSIIVDNK